MFLMKSLFRVALPLAAVAIAAAPAFAQNYPTKPITLTVPFAPGGTTDIIARVVSQPLSTALGKQVIIENKGGGGGAIGALDTARAAPDGYNLGVATVSTIATNPATNSHLQYNPLTDFTPIVNLAATPNIIAVNPKFPGHDYKSFVAELKAHPGKYSYASSGTGGISNLLMETYKSLAGVFVTHVPYRGAGPALNDVVGGQVEIIFDNVPSTLPFVLNHQLIAIAVAAPHRLAQLPNVPTFKELGLEPVNRVAFYGIYGPKGLPQEVVTKVHDAAVKALQDPRVKKKIEDTGSFVIGNTPQQFAQQIKDEYTAYKNVADKLHIKVD
jgi:tripartite-type tricarboxylate transporter receptor subunit TctC